MTKRKINRVFAKFILLLFVFNMLFLPFAEPVYAKDDEGQSVHYDPATYRVNFSLPVDKKEYTITECEKVVSEIIRPRMSDLEKYYTLAIWTNKHVVYDWDFYSEGYNFDYYRHHWDSYGAMKEDEKSVCVGISIFYSNMCHAAGLPCKFVRTKPELMEHILNYIPDINDNAYYVDITEAAFLASERSHDSCEPKVDKEFAHITKPCTEATFDYQDNESLSSTNIKYCYDKPFSEWFKEFALHENTTKVFDTPYVEKGSGTYGTHYADYHDYPSDFTEHPDVWFLDDFYEDPAAIKSKILDKEFDEQLLDIAGIKKNYECDSVEELQEAVEEDISVKYFPTSENGEIVAKSAKLTKGVDYTIEYESYDDSTKTNVFSVKGIGEYKGACQIHVKTHSDVVVKEPVYETELVYDGSPQELVEPGKAEFGEMQYAVGNRSEPTEEFTTELPTAVDAGKYFVWYKASGDSEHEATQPQRMEGMVEIAVSDLDITAATTIPVGKTVVIHPAVKTDLPVKYTFFTFNEDIVSVTEDGTVTGLKEGKAEVTVKAELKEPNPNYKSEERTVVRFTVVPDTVDISGAEVGLSKSAFTYNGEIQKPVIRTIKGLEMEEGTDYTASWSNESSKNAGTYTVTIKGKGKYTGTTEAAYKIEKAANTITARNAAKSYSAQAQSFDLGVKVKSGTPTYKSNNKSVTVSKAGKVTVKAKFIGNVTITITSPASTNYTSATKSVVVKVVPTKTKFTSAANSASKKMTLKWVKRTNATGYIIQYSTSSKFTNAKTVRVEKNTTVSKTIGNLVKGKRYFVRIKTYKTVNRVKYYSGWSDMKSVKISK